MRAHDDNVGVRHALTAHLCALSGAEALADGLDGCERRASQRLLDCPAVSPGYPQAPSCRPTSAGERMDQHRGDAERAGDRQALLPAPPKQLRA
jgi:hypothetical protein